MSLREAAQQALEALELAGMSHDVMLMSDPPQDAWKARSVNWKLAEAMNALRAALAEPTSQESRQVEPVAWRFYDGKIWCYVNHISDLSASTKFEPLYPAPPKRKPLTDEEIESMWEADNTSDEDCRSLYYFKVVASAIERAHGIGGEE